MSWHNLMTWAARVAILILICANLLSAATQKTALVIGNGAYQTLPLKNPVNDATDMATVLRQLAFDVTLVIDADRRSMQRAIRTMGMKLRQGGVGLFYFAGHGVQIKGRNYLIPVGAVIESAADVEFEAVDAGRVLAQMEDAQNGLNIVILDACRDNPYRKNFRTLQRGLAQMDAPKGAFIAYATAPGAGAADGTGRNGIFTKHLLETIRIPGAKIEEVLKRVRIAVAAETNDKQIPWQSSSLMGDFYFNPPPTPGKPDKKEASSSRLSTLDTSSVNENKIDRGKLLAGVNRALRSSPAPFLVDDFEDGNLLCESLQQYWTVRIKGGAIAEHSLDTSEGYGGSAGSLKLHYDVKENTDEVWLRLFQFPEAGNFYDLRAFRRLVFYLKGQKKNSWISRANRIGAVILSYDERARTNAGRPYAVYWTPNTMGVRPGTEWQRVVFNFDDFVPTNWTKRNVTGYQEKPVLESISMITFYVTACCQRGGRDENTIWIDDIRLE